MADQSDIITVKEKLGVNPLQGGTKIYPSDPSRSYTYDFVDPKSVSPYKLMDDCYFGDGDVKSGKYLVPFNREYHYMERRTIAAYKNFVKPIIRALIDPVFSEEAPRVITDEAGNETDNLMANTFIEDVDNDGTPMQEYTEDIVETARRHGVCFCLIDNFSAEEQPATAQQAIDSRIMPYTVKKTAEEVVAWHCDEFGKLEDIMFAETAVLREGTYHRRAMKWTTEYSVLMEEQTKNIDGVSRLEWVEVGTPVVHGLGVIPVVQVYAVRKRSKDAILVLPPMYDIAMLNLVIWNLDSEIRDLQRSSGFSLLVIQTDNVASVTVGPKNALVIPMDATIAPTYISPDPSIMAGLVEANKANREDLFRMAEQQGVYGVRSESSGVSMAYRFYGQETQLKKTSRMATVFENSVMDLFKLWTGEEFTYTVQYPEDFQPGDTGAEVDVYDKALGMSPPKKMRQKVFEKLARLLFADEDAEEVQKIVDDIYAEEQAQPAAPAQPAPDREEEDDEDEDGDTGQSAE
jgi:hypothetical protein